MFLITLVWAVWESAVFIWRRLGDGLFIDLPAARQQSGGSCGECDVFGIDLAMLCFAVCLLCGCLVFYVFDVLLMCF